MRRERIQVNGQMVGIHYINNDSKPVILFLHALGSTGDSFRRLMERLCKDFTVVAVDLPGHGGTSNLVKWNHQTLSAWLESVFFSLGIDCAHIAGHSIGGDVALQFAARFQKRVNSVILLDGGYLRSEAFGMSVGEEVKHTEAHCLRYHFPTWNEFNQQPEADAVRSSMHENNGRIELKVDADAAKQLVGLMSSQPTQELLEQLSVPILLLRSTEPESMNPIRRKETNRIREFLPIKVVDILRATHDLPIDHPERVAAQMKKFV